jgi:hypothetical protein
MLTESSQHVFNLIAGVDDHGFVRGLVADNRAVALQWSDGKNFVDHAFIVTIAEAGSDAPRSEIETLESNSYLP